MATETYTIPEPPGLPLIGNAPVPGLQDGINVKQLAKDYGSIFRVRLGGRSVIFIADHELASEAFDEKRFHKSVQTALKQVREGVHDGLFTAFDDEEAWGKAHRVLIPAIGPLPIRNMFDEMYDISSQLAMKFARQGPFEAIHTTEDFTRLALDTIALCSMDYRFNSFYKEETHPFVKAMSEFLAESGARHQRPGILPGWMYSKANDKFYADIKLMRDIADQVVETRRRYPNDRKDLLAAMLDGVDKRTGERLSGDNITNQLITFLIAGHETTSGTLSFAFYNLLKNPEEYKKVQQEVDEVVGQTPIRVEHLSKLPYIAAVLRETLRHNSPIGAITVEPYEDTMLGGRYPIPKGQAIHCLLDRVHHDPAVYGADVDEFKPDRMLEDVHAQRLREFPNCWKPFGNGKRGCIGRPFAWQEMMLCVAMLFQNFDFEMDDPKYELRVEKTLTIKPEGFKMKARLRHGLSATELGEILAGSRDITAEKRDSSKNSSEVDLLDQSGQPIAIYYGSNSGTCEAMAQQLASDARHHGFNASALGPLDEAAQKLPTDRPVVIVTASYEGKPPSNAETFIPWLESLSADEAKDVDFAVFGCGHRDWIDTFHRIPKLIDAKLEEGSGSRLVPLSCTDAADRDMFSDFERWEDEVLWPALKEKYGISGGSKTEAGGLSVEMKSPRKETFGRNLEEGTVVAERTLTSPGALTSKKHIEIQLPRGMSYNVGDYLNILPQNHPESVARVLRHFGFSGDATMGITADRPTSLPTERDVWIQEVLGSYVEINQPATQRNLVTLVDNASDQAQADGLRAMFEDKKQRGDSLKASVLDLLERFTSVNLTFATYLSMLPPMRVRQYSISSSPLPDPTKLSLTYSILDAPSTVHSGRHLGVATTFLSSLRPGDKLHIDMRPCISTFHPPADHASTPIIMIAAGSGLAPFRGFIQERSLLLSKQKMELAPALLFFGCRQEGEDDIYKEELGELEEQGVVSVRRAYSRANEGGEYVQGRIYRDRDELWEMWEAGAKVYVCGSRKMAKAAEDVCVEFLSEKMGKGPSNGLEWWTSRFAADVFD